MAPTDSDQPDLPESRHPAAGDERPVPPLPREADLPARICPNCGHHLSPTDRFCGECRQKYTTQPASMRELFSDFFDTLFNIDNRVLQSLLGIVIPGRLTNHYMAGIQRRYLSPIRWFFVAAIVCLTCVGFAVDEPLDQAFRSNKQMQDRTAFHDMMADEVIDARDSVLTMFPQEPTVDAALDSLLQLIDADRGDTLTYTYFVFHSSSVNFTTRNVPMSAQDVVLLPIETLLDTYEIEDFWYRLQLRQIIKINRDGNNASRFLLGQMVWAVLLMVPFLALFMKLLYLRRSRYYVEHFVFTLHVHTFVFVLYTLSLLGYLAFGWTQPLTLAGLLVAIYFYVAMLRVYRQGWFKTLVKFFILSLAYWVVLAASFTFVLLVSVLIY